MKASKNILESLDLKMPIRTREEKIIIQALNWLQRLQYEPNKNQRNVYLKCAIATLETLLLKDDLKGTNNETTK